MIYGDTVVMITLQQAKQLNQRFLNLTTALDSTNHVIDSLNTQLACEIVENNKLREEVIYSYEMLNKQRKKNNKNIVDGIISLGIITLTAYVTDFLKHK